MSGARPLAVGDLVRDNDPRMDTRPVMRVEHLQADAAGHIWAFLDYRDGWAKTAVNAKRIHLDGKVRRSGWTRIGRE